MFFLNQTKFILALCTFSSDDYVTDIYLHIHVLRKVNPCMLLGTILVTTHV